MSAHDDALQSLESFLDDGWISEVLFEVKSGKEATVFCCRGGERASGAELVAAKVYRALEGRRFKNDAIYQAGRVHLARDGRFKRAAENKSAFGRKVQYATWLENEWETMNLLHDANVDLPRPFTRNDRAILMPYLGNKDGPAPKLAETDLPREAASGVVDRLLWNVETMLDQDRVHGDLSPFNVLWWQQQAVIIDFPQAIDPRLNPAGHTLLTRDIENICQWARKQGVQRDAGKLTSRMWSKFILGEIG